MDFKDTTAILTKVSVLFDKPITKEKIALWHELFFTELKEQFEQAMRMTIKQTKFFPMPSEVQANLDLIKDGKKETAGDAWGRVVSYASGGMNLKAVQTAEKDNEKTLTALRQIDYTRVRYGDVEKEIPFVKRQFFSAYESADKKENQYKAIECNQNEMQILKQLGMNNFNVLKGISSNGK